MIQMPISFENKQRFTAAEALILQILGDGKARSKYELRELTGLDSADRRARELRKKGYNIECTMQGNVGYYRLIK